MSEADRSLCLTVAAGLNALRALAALGLALTIIAVLLLASRPLHGHALAASLTTTAAAPSVVVPSVAAPSVAAPSVAAPSVAAPSAAASSAAAPSLATAQWMLAVLVLALALFERLCAVRIAFDARLFAALGSSQLPSLAALDQSLAGLGLRKNAQPGRELAARLSGTRRLVLMHLLVVCTQAAFCGLILWQTA